MLDWYSDCAPGPNPEEAGLIPASSTNKKQLNGFALDLNKYIINRFI